MKHDRLEDRPEEPAPQPLRRARLQALLFAGAALGTTLLTIGGTIDPKIPPFKGE
jgi:hypothetical protein